MLVATELFISILVVSLSPFLLFPKAFLVSSSRIRFLAYFCLCVCWCHCSFFVNHAHILFILFLVLYQVNDKKRTQKMQHKHKSSFRCISCVKYSLFSNFNFLFCSSESVWFACISFASECKYDKSAMKICLPKPLWITQKYFTMDVKWKRKIYGEPN